MSSDTATQNEPVIACNLNVIAADQRDQHIQTVREVFAAFQEFKELPNGYAFRLPTESAVMVKAAEFIANERLCCPFIEFTLDIEPNAGPIWLRLTGSEGVKAFIPIEFAPALKLNIAPTANLQA